MKRLSIIIISIMMLLAGCNVVQKNNETKNVTDGEEKRQQTQSTKGYCFNYKNTNIGIDMSMDIIAEAIGKPENHREKYSDELQGNSKMYDYGSFEINTLNTDNGEYIVAIYFKDDLISTEEGICLYMTKRDVIKAYGDQFREEMNVYVYEKDGMKLRFIFEDDDIINIEYFSNMVY